jgi:hypothetical protein
LDWPGEIFADDDQVAMVALSEYPDGFRVKMFRVQGLILRDKDVEI